MPSPLKSFEESFSTSPHDPSDPSSLTRRVVLIGDPRSGKRTFASRLFTAASQHFPSSSSLSPSSPSPSSPSPPAGAAGGLSFFARGAGVSHAALRGGRGGAVVEFFCCDSPGGLAAALPTAAALATSVVCVVADAGAPRRLRARLRLWLRAAAAHAAETLRAETPRRDEVRRMRLVERQRRFWRTRARALHAWRARWRNAERGMERAEREEVEAEGEGEGEGEGEEEEEEAKREQEEEALPLPDEDVAGPLKTLIVCTRTDVLEQLSRETPHGAALCAAGVSLLELVAQEVRREAVERHCALVAVSSGVHTTAAAAPAAAEDTPSTCVHPLYKTLWTYVAQLLFDADAESGEEEPAARSEEMEAQVSAKFFPHAFLPHGVDCLELLSPFVTATDAITLESVFADADAPDEDKGGSTRMHEQYMQEIENLLASAGPDEEAMIWDKL